MMMTQGLGSFLTSNLDEFGRNGDNKLVHMRTGEIAVHPSLLEKNPKLAQGIAEAFAREGRDISEFMVGSGKMNVNPMTGFEEAFLDIDLIGGIKDLFQKAAPILLPAIVGSLIPGGNPFFTGAIAGGVGSLLQGGDTKDALKAALLGGTASGVTSMARGGYFFKGQEGNLFGNPLKNPKFSRAEDNTGSFIDRFTGEVKDFFTNPEKTAAEVGEEIYGKGFDLASLSAGERSELFDIAKDSGGINYLRAVPAGLAVAGAFGAFDPIEEEKPEEIITSRELFNQNPSMYSVGNIIAPNRQRFPDDIIRTAAKGGEMEFPRKTGAIEGPGTETSDDIPAMLSDGEFVMTARAVRGAGNGDRKTGVENMYKMMKAFEGGAVA